MKTLRHILVLLLALAGAPAVAHGQDPQQRIDAARHQAGAAGIPVSLLESKVAEGRAKGVPMDRIATAVERRLASLSQARAVMGSAPRNTPVTVPDLSVGADALEAGVAPEALGQLTASAPAGTRAVAIAALTELVRGGESSDRALARVQAAVARGPEALRRLPGEAAAERSRRGAPPGHDPSRGGNNGVRGRGRGNGGPPAAVPGPTARPGRGNGRGNGNGNKP